jgi:DNA-binding Xre family transcriptional regulator
MINKLNTASDLQKLVDETMPENAQKRARHKADGMINEINFLNNLRKHRHLTQTELAEKLGITQVNVSLTEKREDSVTLQTILRYVEAMGGKLELRVKFPDDETVKYGF